MSIRYDPLLVRALARELGARTVGAPLEALMLDRDRRVAALGFRRGGWLLLLLHPGAGHLLLREGAPPAWPAAVELSLRGRRLARIHAPPDERLLVLTLGAERTGETDRAGKPPLRLVVELHDNQWNALLLGRAGGEDGRADAGWRVREALWPRRAGGRRLEPGAPYRCPVARRRWRERPPTERAWLELLEELPAGERRGVLLREAAWLGSLTADFVLGEAGAAAEPGDDGPPGSAEGGEEARRGKAEARPGRAEARAGEEASPVDRGLLLAARRRYLSLHPAGPGPRNGEGDGQQNGDGEENGRRGAWLLPVRDGLQPHPFRLGRPEAERTPDLATAMERSLRRSERWAAVAGLSGEGGAPAADPGTVRLREALEARRDRLRRRLGALAHELERGDDPDTLRETGHLLLARLDRLERGRERVRLEGFDGRLREVALDPALSPAGNAERYYREAARRERALRRLPERIRKTEEMLARVEAALVSLEEEAPPVGERRERLRRLAGGEAGEGAGAGEGRAGGGRGTGRRLPYRRLFTSGGREIRVGRGARSNEELTFHHSHTEDIWLHARQVPGAHVILRWGRKGENPPRRDLLEAAVVAAVHSDARHSGTVGVDWTRRKYVRSPRKSAPGVVVPSRVETVFVEPDEALVERLKRNRP